MALVVKHPFESRKGDGSDATLVRPSNWNEDHKVELASNTIIGRIEPGPGDAAELPVTPYMIGLLNHPDYAALASALGLPTTGDARLTYKPTPDVGWIFANDGSIGDVGSGASVASAATQALFTLFYDTMEYATPLLTTNGSATTRAAQGTALNAFAAKCRMVIPKLLGRALIVGGGAGAGLTARYAGQIGGAETHVLSIGEMPKHRIAFSGSLSGTATGGTACGSGTMSGATASDAKTGITNTDHTHVISISGGVSATGTWNHTHGINFIGWDGVGGKYPVLAMNANPGAGYVGFGGGGAYAPQAYTWNNTDYNLDHTHGHNITAGSSFINGTHYPTGVEHRHNVNGVTVSGSCTVNSITVSIDTTATCSGYTDYIGSDTAHNNMQPWTAWNVMIRL